ncbi:MAG TPA: hypothetical protein VKZ82_28370 [Nonomuraea sp.]|nr:hypothetical protein [Nonomuraea sp.]
MSADDRAQRVEDHYQQSARSLAERLADLEDEAARLRGVLAHARRFTWELEPDGQWLNLEHRGADTWLITRDGDEVAIVTGQAAALEKARRIVEEGA